jgi:hypothetical protein
MGRLRAVYLRRYDHVRDEQVIFAHVLVESHYIIIGEPLAAAREDF